MACKGKRNKAYIVANGEVYREANRKASAKYHNMRRLNDPEWRAQRNSINVARIKQKYINDPIYRAAEIARGAIKAKLNPAQYARSTAKRRAIKLCATPIWLSNADNSAIADLYTLAVQITQKTGILHHVDHIVPLQGKVVCGLHVPWNLQILPASENISKGNRYADI